MESQAAHLARPPFSVTLRLWGAPPGGPWWGAITWQQMLDGPNARVEIPFAAWVPATELSRPNWANRANVTRVELPADQGLWLPPPAWPLWYAGVWGPGAQLDVPDGLSIVTGPAWRNRPSGSPRPKLG